MEEFNRTASVVATNIQKLVQNVSSMQRMLVHVETQVLVFSSSSPNDILSKRARGWDLSWDSCSTTLASWRRTPQGSSSSLQTHRLNQYCLWTLKPSAEAARFFYLSLFFQCLRIVWGDWQWSTSSKGEVARWIHKGGTSTWSYFY